MPTSHLGLSELLLSPSSLHLLLGLAVLLDLDIHQMDIDSAFLQTNLKEKVSVHQPEGFVSLEHPYKVSLPNFWEGLR